jgi:hypothetical protein
MATELCLLKVYFPESAFSCGGKTHKNRFKLLGSQKKTKKRIFLLVFSTDVPTDRSCKFNGGFAVRIIRLIYIQMFFPVLSRLLVEASFYGREALV